MLYKHPGSFHDIKAIEKLQGDRCDVGGCGLELAIQLLFIMTFDCLKRNYLSIFWPYISAFNVCNILSVQLYFLGDSIVALRNVDIALHIPKCYQDGNRTFI